MSFILHFIPAVAVWLFFFVFCIILYNLCYNQNRRKKLALPINGKTCNTWTTNSRIHLSNAQPKNNRTRQKTHTVTHPFQCSSYLLKYLKTIFDGNLPYDEYASKLFDKKRQQNANEHIFSSLINNRKYKKENFELQKKETDKRKENEMLAIKSSKRIKENWLKTNFVGISWVPCIVLFCLK